MKPEVVKEREGRRKLEDGHDGDFRRLTGSRGSREGTENKVKKEWRRWRLWLMVVTGRGVGYGGFDGEGEDDWRWFTAMLFHSNLCFCQTWWWFSLPTCVLSSSSLSQIIQMWGQTHCSLLVQEVAGGNGEDEKLAAGCTKRRRRKIGRRRFR